MTVLVLDEALLAGSLARAGDEDVIVVQHAAADLERIEFATADPRVLYLIGDPSLLPLPDRSVDAVLGGDGGPETARVLRS